MRKYYGYICLLSESSRIITKTFLRFVCYVRLCAAALEGKVGHEPQASVGIRLTNSHVHQEMIYVESGD